MKKTYEIREPGNQNRLIARGRYSSANDAMRETGCAKEYRILMVDNRPGWPSIIDVQRKD